MGRTKGRTNSGAALGRDAAGESPARREAAREARLRDRGSRPGTLQEKEFIQQRVSDAGEAARSGRRRGSSADLRRAPETNARPCAFPWQRCSAWCCRRGKETAKRCSRWRARRAHPWRRRTRGHRCPRLPSGLGPPPRNGRKSPGAPAGRKPRSAMRRGKAQHVPVTGSCSAETKFGWAVMPMTSGEAAVASRARLQSVARISVSVLLGRRAAEAFASSGW